MTSLSEQQSLPQRQLSLDAHVAAERYLVKTNIGTDDYPFYTVWTNRPFVDSVIDVPDADVMRNCGAGIELIIELATNYELTKAALNELNGSSDDDTGKTLLSSWLNRIMRRY